MDIKPVTRYEHEGWIYRFRPTHNITSPNGDTYELKYAFDENYVPYSNEVIEVLNVWKSSKN
jgi:hypothetical protein